jgi:hypothetical protein
MLWWKTNMNSHYLNLKKTTSVFLPEFKVPILANLWESSLQRTEVLVKLQTITDQISILSTFLKISTHLKPCHLTRTQNVKLIPTLITSFSPTNSRWQKSSAFATSTKDKPSSTKRLKLKPSLITMIWSP